VKSNRVRVLLAVMAAGAALTACSPIQAGAAAIVGQDRITSDDLNRGVEDYQNAIKTTKLPAQQAPFSSVPQGVLLQLVDIKQYTQLAARHGVTITEGEIDNARAQVQGGSAQLDQTMLAQGVPPSQNRAWIRAQLGIQKLLVQAGAGSDQASQQQAEQKVLKELATIPVKVSPRFGKVDPQTGQLAALERFGAADKG
jgi:peptidyl-prolyl cis-trans isomerase SurA